MAVDKTEPKTALIVLITALVVVTLFGLKFVFDSYFTSVAETYVQEQVLDSPAGTKNRRQLEQEWEGQLAASPTIEDAMRQLARGGRGGVALVAPSPSEDMGALTGWSHRRPGDHTRPIAYGVPPRPQVVDPMMDPTPMPDPNAPVPEVGTPSIEGQPAPGATQGGLPPPAPEPAAVPAPAKVRPRPPVPAEPASP